MSKTLAKLLRDDHHQLEIRKTEMLTIKTCRDRLDQCMKIGSTWMPLCVRAKTTQRKKMEYKGWRFGRGEDRWTTYDTQQGIWKRQRRELALLVTFVWRERITSHISLCHRGRYSAGGCGLYLKGIMGGRERVGKEKRIEKESREIERDVKICKHSRKKGKLGLV